MPKHCSIRFATLRLSLLIGLTASILAGCGTSRPSSSPSVNHNSRVSIIVIHHTTGNFEDSLRILTQPSDRPVSSHYLIPEPGDPSYERHRMRVYQLVPEARRAWHAGDSSWGGKIGLNDQSIGIELVNQTYCHTSSVENNGSDGQKPRICFYPDFADGQIDLLVALLAKIRERHPDIQPTRIVGHADIAPDRKIDPGPRFPWQRLYRLGYGAWFDDATVIRYWEQFAQHPLPMCNVQFGLQVYGYGIETSGVLDEHTRNVLRAFQMHFRPSEVSSEATTDTVAILVALIEKYYPERLDELLGVPESCATDDHPVGEAEGATLDAI